MDAITFERLPEAVTQLFNKLEQIEKVLLLIRREEQPTQQDDLLTVEQVAVFLDLTVPTIYSKTCKGELPFMKRGKRLYFSREKIIDYLKQGSQKSYAQIKASPEDYLKGQRRRRT